MSAGSLIPDQQLTFSTDLAATIGLEEAILLQGVGPQLPRTPGQWHALVLSTLEKQFPFWTRARILELVQRLAELGIIAVLNDNNPNSLKVAIAGQTQQPSPIPEHWQPAADSLDLLALNHGIDRQFAQAQLSTFDRGAADHTRDNRFRQHVLAAWRRQQRAHTAFDVRPPPPFDSHWQPSQDACDIMARAGIDADFIESVRPEFILYWRERGGPPKEVESRFVSFVRDRWIRHTSGLSHSTEPTRLQRNWQPREDALDVLASAGVTREYALEKVPEFVLFWCETNELQRSWDSKFVQHVKHQWRWEQRQETGNGKEQRGGDIGGTHRTRERSTLDDLNDTSWAG